MRELRATSVSTIIRILEQKGFVRSRKEGRAEQGYENDRGYLARVTAAVIVLKNTHRLQLGT